jgi:hypothetical protein
MKLLVFQYNGKSYFQKGRHYYSLNRLLANLNGNLSKGKSEPNYNKRVVIYLGVRVKVAVPTQSRATQCRKLHPTNFHIMRLLRTEVIYQ